jgi:hypothetical protein
MKDASGYKTALVTFSKCVYSNSGLRHNFYNCRVYHFSCSVLTKTKVIETLSFLICVSLDKELGSVWKHKCSGEYSHLRRMGWTIGILGFVSRQGLGIFLFTTASKTALGSTQPSIQWIKGALSLGVKRPWRESDHSPPSSAEVKEWVELYLHSPITPSWRGAQFEKNAQGQLYLYLYITGNLMIYTGYLVLLRVLTIMRLHWVGQLRNVYRILKRKSLWKWKLSITRSKWEDEISNDFLK